MHQYVCDCVCVCEDVEAQSLQPDPGAAVMIMAIWARSLSSSLSSAVIFSRAAGSALCLGCGPTFMAAFRDATWGLDVFWFTELSFRGGNWNLWRTKLMLQHNGQWTQCIYCLQNVFINVSQCLYLVLAKLSPSSSYTQRTSANVGTAAVSTVNSVQPWGLLLNMGIWA